MQTRETVRAVERTADSRDSSPGYHGEKEQRSQVDETSTGHRILAHFTDDIKPTLFAELQLVMLTFCTGIQGKPDFSLPTSAQPTY